jgi:hypothetical protein
MLFEALAVVNFAFAGFDAWLSNRRINEYGVEVELNPWIIWLTKLFGPELGTVTTTVGVAIVQTGVCELIHQTWVLAIIIGLRLKMFQYQIHSLRVERENKAAIHEFIKQRNSGSNGASLPPSAPSAPSHGPEDIKDTDDTHNS